MRAVHRCALFALLSALELFAQRPALSLERDVFIPSFLGVLPAPDWHGKLLLALDNRTGHQVLIEAVDGEGVGESLSFEVPDSQINVMAVGTPIATQLGTREVSGQSFDLGTTPPGAPEDLDGRSRGEAYRETVGRRRPPR